MLAPISVNTSIYFRKNNPQKLQTPKTEDKNPISRKGEAMKLIGATFLGGLVLAGKLILELAENGDFLVEIFSKKAEKIAKEKGKQVNKEEILKQAKKQVKDKRTLNTIGAFVGLVAAFFAGFALLYTAFNAPKIAYESKVNAFQKSKEMDVYTKSNTAERELYTQLDEKAKNSDAEEKEQLKEQYLKLKNAKNQVPDFVKLKK